jgi:hypothetical protein
MAQSPVPQQTNPLGTASLVLGIVSAALVFGIGICAISGSAQKWINIASTPLFVCGASSAFLGVIGALLGFAGLWGKNKPKSAAAAGLTLGMIGLCLFMVVLNLVGAGGK